MFNLAYIPFEPLVGGILYALFAFLDNRRGKIAESAALKPNEEVLANSLSIALNQLSELKASPNDLPTSLVAFASAMDDLATVQDADDTSDKLCQKMTDAIRHFTKNDAAFTRGGIEKFYRTGREILHWAPREADTVPKPTQKAIAGFKAALEGLLYMQVPPPSASDTFEISRGKSLAIVLSKELRELFDISSAAFKDASTRSNILLEPARLVVPAIAAILVVVGFVFSTVSDNLAALKEISPWLNWFWLYVAVTLSAAVYIAFSNYADFFKFEHVPDKHKNNANNILYAFFFFTVFRAFLIYFVFFNLVLPDVAAKPPPGGTCCGDLAGRMAALEKRVADLESAGHGGGNIAGLMERIASATEQIAAQKPLDASALNPISDQLKNINDTLNTSFNGEHLKSIAEQLTKVALALENPIDVRNLDSITLQLKSIADILKSLLPSSPSLPTDENWATVEGEDTVVYFAPNQTYISETRRVELVLQGVAMKARKNCLVLAQGYSDPKGGEAPNLLISLQRIAAVLQAMDIPLTENVIISPLGKSPIGTPEWSAADRQNDKLKALHRRVEVSQLCPKTADKGLLHPRDYSIQDKIRAVK